MEHTIPANELQPHSCNLSFFQRTLLHTHFFDTKNKTDFLWTWIHLSAELLRYGLNMAGCQHELGLKQHELLLFRMQILKAKFRSYAMPRGPDKGGRSCRLSTPSVPTAPAQGTAMHVPIVNTNTVPFVVSDEHAVKHLSPALGSSFIASSAYQKQPPWGGIGWAFPWGRRQGALALKYLEQKR